MKISEFTVSTSLLSIFFMFSKTLEYFLVEFPALDHIRPSATLDDQAQAAQDLIGRVIGARANQFKVVIEGFEGTDVRDTFNVSLITVLTCDLRCKNCLVIQKKTVLRLKTRTIS